MDQEDDVDILHLAAAVLLFDGRASEAAFEMMLVEGAFPRLVDLIRDKCDDDNGLHRLLLELLFEMSRIQTLSREDLSKSVRLAQHVVEYSDLIVNIDDAFVLLLLQLIEQLSDDADDPYHYPIIRVLVYLMRSLLPLSSVPKLTSDSLF